LALLQVVAVVAVLLAVPELLEQVVVALVPAALLVLLRVQLAVAARLLAVTIW